jgi:hypothetical protein
MLLLVAGCTLPVVRRTEIQPGPDNEVGVGPVYFQGLRGGAWPGNPEWVPPVHSVACLGVLGYGRLGYNIGHHFGLDLTGYGCLGSRVPGFDTASFFAYASFGARARPLNANWLVFLDVPYPDFSVGTTVGLPLQESEVWDIQAALEFLGPTLPLGLAMKPVTASLGVARNFNLETVTISPNVSVTMSVQQLSLPYRVLAGVTFRRPRKD